MMFSPIINVLLFTFMLYKTTEAAVAIYGPEEKPPEFADQKGCYLSSLKMFLKVGVPYSPQDGKSCQQYLCGKNGETQLFTCGVLGVDKGCEEVEGDQFLPYPDCCNTIKCYEEDGTCIDDN